MLYIRIPKKVIEDIKYNAEHKTCSQCMRIYAQIKGNTVEPKSLSMDDYAHLLYAIHSYYTRRVSYNLQLLVSISEALYYIGFEAKPKNVNINRVQELYFRLHDLIEELKENEY